MDEQNCRGQADMCQVDLASVGDDSWIPGFTTRFALSVRCQSMYSYDI